jgi:hypothetical protein
MVATTPSRINRRAISAQSHCDSDRPRVSGRSQAILTMWRATEGGKGGLSPAPRPIAQAVESALEIASDPFAGVLLGHAGQSGGSDEGFAVGDGQDGAAAASQAQGDGGAAEAGLKGVAFLGRETHDELGLAATHDDPPGVGSSGPPTEKIDERR